MLRFKVMPDGSEPYEVVATTRDIVMWEKTTKGASFQKLQNDMHATDLYKVCYFAARRNQHFNGTQAEFEESCDLDVLPDRDDDGLDPTQQARSTAES